jgi:diacylglycerol kinase family enzyme
MELAPFPYGRLPGFHRASPSTPLDAYSYVGGSIPTGCGSYRLPSRREALVGALAPRDADDAASKLREVWRRGVTRWPRRCSGLGMAAAGTDPLERLESALRAGSDAPRRHMLIIVNPYATTVSDRLKNLVVYALRGTYQVHAVETEARDHATELCRDAAREGYDVVVAFGGDGTVNEAANGLAGSETPLTCLPGGRANVYCRMLGIPVDVVDATEQLLRIADDWRPRAVDLGYVGERKFLFSAGAGLDASVVERVDAHPRLKARFGEWYYAGTAVRTFNRRYLLHPLRLEASLGEERVSGVSMVVQNATPYTYFGNRPIEMAEGATLHSGNLAGIVLKRASPLDIPTILWRALSKRARFVKHRQVHPFTGVERLRVRSLDDRPLPLQVDGDYIGETPEAEFGVVADALRVVS